MTYPIISAAISAACLLLAVFTALRILRPDDTVSFSTDRKNADALLCALFWVAFYLTLW